MERLFLIHAEEGDLLLDVEGELAVIFLIIDEIAREE